MLKGRLVRDADLTLRPIDHNSARRSISLIWRKRSPLAQRFNEISATLKQTAAELLQ